jgi:hypothetical protein
MPRVSSDATGISRLPALIAAVTTAAYGAMKVVYAIDGKLGLPGFPAAAGHDERANISRDEWGNVALAAVATGIALATAQPAGRRLPRWLLAAAVWGAFVALGAGAAGFTLRATRILPDLGSGPTGWPTWLVLAVLDLGAIAWGITAVQLSRWPQGRHVRVLRKEHP